VRAAEASPGRAPASPLARRIARESGVDLAALATRLGRPVQASDVLASATASGVTAPAGPVAGDVAAVSSGWRTMAERTLAR
jgi:pyruvate/2-oxoglutarate dehydrogenase complex dihydrolipoamide acyltransferase (E2) component